MPEFANAFNRAGIPFRVVNGLLGLDATPAISLADEVTHERPEAVRAWREIEEWVRAAAVRRTLAAQSLRLSWQYLQRHARYVQRLHHDPGADRAACEVLEMCDLARLLEDVTAAGCQSRSAPRCSRCSRSAATRHPTRSRASQPMSRWSGRAEWPPPRKSWCASSISTRCPITIMARPAARTSSCRPALSSGIRC